MDKFLFDKRFTYIERLGKGSFGSVDKYYDTRDNVEVAIKQAEVHFDDNKNELGSLNHEFDLVKKLTAQSTHPNILFYKEFFRFKERDVLKDFAVMQYCNWNLHSLLKQNELNEETLTENQIYHLVRGLLSGLQFLHDNDVIHQDIKPENLLIIKNPLNGLYILKIADFGISSIVEKVRSSYVMPIGKGGTTEYTAPEVIDGREREIRFNADLWSTGLVVYYIFTSHNPFNSKVDVLKGFDLSLLRNIPEPYHTIIEMCMVSQSKHRVKSANELLKILGNEPKSEEELYKDLKYTNNILEIDAFLQKFPHTEYFKELQQLKTTLLIRKEVEKIFNEKDQSRKISLASNFIDKYPTSEYVAEVNNIINAHNRQIALNDLVSNPTEFKLHEFQTKYADYINSSTGTWLTTLHAIEETILYNKCINSGTESICKDFLQKYPKSTYKSKVEQILKDIQKSERTEGTFVYEKPTSSTTIYNQTTNKTHSNDSDGIATSTKKNTKSLKPFYVIGGLLLLSFGAYKVFVSRNSTNEIQNTVTTASQAADSANVSSSGFIDPFADNMIEIKGGEFMMGTNSLSEFEKPVHKVTVGDFKICKYEVGEYDYAPFGESPNTPQVNLTISEINNFIEALNKKTGKHYRLPTEEEWEYVAQKDYKEGLNFSNELLPVNEGTVGNLGLYNMFGNVKEICNSKWDMYDGRKINNKYVIRGGSAISIKEDFNPYARYAFDLSKSNQKFQEYVGFRLVDDIINKAPLAATISKK
jgi:serine/threonine protein kinase